VIEVLPAGTVYKLAAKATPDDVRKAVVLEIASGATVSATEVERRIEEARTVARARQDAEREVAEAERQRLHELIERLKQINETDDEARDKAIQFALMDVGRIAPESSRSYYE